MADYRGSMLPTIKCSQCSRDIAIENMGDHICGGASQLSSSPESYGNFNNIPSTQNSSSSHGNLKPARAMPPRVDTSAANRPFLRQDQLTPVSMSPSRSNSPLSFNDKAQSPFGKLTGPQRSATAPTINHPPSPEMLSSNLDCAFPPFPTTAARPVTPQLSAREGGYGGLAKNDAMFAPLSPRNVSEGPLLKRMNTIAPGPFDVNGRRNADGQSGRRVHERQKSMKDGYPASRMADIGGDIMRPNTSSGHTRNSSSKGSRAGLPKAPTKETYGGFGGRTPDDDGRPEFLRPEDRSQTFPLRSESPSYRRPSEPDTRMRRPSNETSGRRPSINDLSHRKPSVGPDLSRPLPPRGTSLLRPRNDRSDSRLEDAPPVPSNVDLAAEFGIGNPYHTPSGSQSSDGSAYSEMSKTSSRSSPPLSARPELRRGNSSASNKIDHLMSEVQSSLADLQPKETFSNSPPKQAKEQFARGMAPPRTLAPAFLSPESPMDPAIQEGRLSPLPPRTQTPQQTLGTPPHTSPQRPVNGRRPASKGNCKGCTKPITGKSISSADGRLTGRYHKECFACTTCLEPFQTSTFYVIDDAPYCERHYHKLNGSVCRTCDKGIEGQYLESEKKEKFHPRCLTCADCKRTLRHDYFEMDGQVYCERDAFQRAQKQRRFLGPTGGTSRMERRTTRLMMM
ncbi:hypothetical protein B0O99DRAFT_199534 [Bisporella sp. PMI_857]|nr:hypothetical protein B0O99DRAFT_199534 [Bisporella sp. PMI_857]